MGSDHSKFYLQPLPLPEFRDNLVPTIAQAVYNFKRCGEPYFLI